MSKYIIQRAAKAVRQAVVYLEPDKGHFPCLFLNRTVEDDVESYKLILLYDRKDEGRSLKPIPLDVQLEMRVVLCGGEPTPLIEMLKQYTKLFERTEKQCTS